MAEGDITRLVAQADQLAKDRVDRNARIAELEAALAAEQTRSRGPLDRDEMVACLDALERERARGGTLGTVPLRAEDKLRDALAALSTPVRDEVL